MFCKNCGVKLEEDSKFCGSCGTAVNIFAALPPLAEPPSLSAEPATPVENIAENSYAQSNERDTSSFETVLFEASGAQIFGGSGAAVAGKIKLTDQRLVFEPERKKEFEIKISIMDIIIYQDAFYHSILRFGMQNNSVIIRTRQGFAYKFLINDKKRDLLTQWLCKANPLVKSVPPERKSEAKAYKCPKDHPLYKQSSKLALRYDVRLSVSVLCMAISAFCFVTIINENIENKARIEYENKARDPEVLANIMADIFTEKYGSDISIDLQKPIASAIEKNEEPSTSTTEKEDLDNFTPDYEEEYYEIEGGSFEDSDSQGQRWEEVIQYICSSERAITDWYYYVSDGIRDETMVYNIFIPAENSNKKVYHMSIYMNIYDAWDYQIDVVDEYVGWETD